MPLHTAGSLNPYVGPRAFEPEDERLGRKLYGRRREARKLVELLIAERIALLHSPSGAGKTSLIQTELRSALLKAGFDVLPVIRVGSPPDEKVLKDYGIAVGDVNRYVLSTLLSLDDGLRRDERTPLADLARMSIKDYLVKLALRKDRQVLARLRSRLAQPGAAARLARLREWLGEVESGKTVTSRGKKAKLRELLAFSELSDEEALWKIGRERRPFLLAFDQFEEILTLAPADKEDKETFFAQVGDVLRDSERWALFSMREDFVAALDPFLECIPTRLSTTFRLDLLDRKNALLAIQEPARNAGKKFTDEAAMQLVENLSRMRIQSPDGSVVDVAGHYVEPAQLQVVCHRLWEQIDADRIERKHVVEGGDVDTALGDYYAEKVREASATPTKDGTTVRESVIREWFDKHLISEQGVRGQVQMGGEYSQGLKTEVIRFLVGAYLVRAEDRRGSTWFELAHDRLIGPIKANNKEWLEKNLRLLQRQAREWAARGKSEGLLLLGEDLRAEQQWAKENPEEVTALEREFLDESRRAQEAIDKQKKEATRFRTLALKALAVMAVALVLLVITSWATIQSRRAKAAADESLKKAEVEKANAQKASDEANKAKERANELLIAANEAKRGLEVANREAEAQKLIAQEAARDAAQARGVAIQEQQTAVEQARLARQSEQKAMAATIKAEDEKNKAVAAQAKAEVLTNERDLTIARLTRAQIALKISLNKTARLSAVASSRARAANAVTEFDKGNVADARKGTYDTLLAMREALDDPQGSYLTRDNLTALEKLLPASQLVMSFADYPQVRSLAFDAKGDCISTVNANGGVKVRGLPGRKCASGEGEKLIANVGEDKKVGEDNQSVSSVSMSANGQVVVVGKSEGRLEKILSAPMSPGTARLPGHRHRVHTTAISDDGRYLASATDLYSYKVLDLETKHKLWKRPTLPSWVGIALFRKDARLMTAFAFSSDNKLVVTADHKGMADMRDIKSGKKLISLPKHAPPSEQTSPPDHAHTGAILAAAISPDGTRLVTADEDKAIRLWDISAIKTGGKAKERPIAKYVRDFTGHDDAVDDMLITKMKDTKNNERLVLVTASRDRTVRLWDLETGNSLFELPAHKGYVNALALAPGNLFLATAGGDNYTRVWNASNVFELSALREELKAIKDKAEDEFDKQGTVSARGRGLEEFTDRLWKVLSTPLTADECKRYLKDDGCLKLFQHGGDPKSPSEP